MSRDREHRRARRARWRWAAGLLSLGALLANLPACRREPSPEKATPGAASASAAAEPGAASSAAAGAEDLRLERDFLELVLAFGASRSAEVRLAGEAARRATLSIRDSGGLGTAISLLPATAEQPAGIALSVRGSEVGMHFGRVTLATGLRAPSELSLNYTLRVEGTLSVTPTNPIFDLGSPGSARQVEVKSRAPGFALRAVSTEGPFAASFSKAPGGAGYAVRVQLVSTRLPETERGVSGKLWLLSNDPSEPRKELPLLALGGPAPAPAPTPAPSK